jgi:TolB protein
MCVLCWAFASLAAVGGGGSTTGSSTDPPASPHASHGYGQAPATALPAPLAATDQDILKPEERRFLRNVRQLTFGQPKDAPAGHPEANYAEAYWSPDGKHLTLQSTRGPFVCDHIFSLDLLTNELKFIGTEAGRTTCSYYTADGKHIIFSSTHETLGADCPPRPDMSHGYVWPIYPYDIYQADAVTGQIERRLTDDSSYDAEGTIDWHTGWLYFTSTRDGDLDIYRGKLTDNGLTDIHRLTDEVGYDGGPFISYDGKTVVYRRGKLDTPEAEAEYKDLLAKHLVKPSKLELWAMDSDGSNKRQLTSNGAANFAPFLHPDNRTLVYASNVHDTEQHRRFELYAMPIDGGQEPVRVTYGGEFEGFPMFSPDGRYLVWCSNRNHANARETNVFIAEWIPIVWDKE